MSVGIDSSSGDVRIAAHYTKDDWRLFQVCVLSPLPVTA